MRATIAAFLLIGTGPLLLLTDSTARAAGPVHVDFNFQVRPLLSDRCYACHGPDDKARKAGLDLRTRETALKGGKSGHPAIQPGDPTGSELLRRISSSDPDEVMPPPESKLPPLSPSEIETLRRWIEQGAEFKPHWAFIPPDESSIHVPVVDETGVTIRNDIDRFVLARLEQEGLRLQPEADKETLLRRVTLDLTGLPPTLDEMDAFLADNSPGAYARVVDRLLASPHYGERMAQEWMDLARFADTYGYQADVDRDLSPWRDWVISAFNEDLPWDQFITWQLAGDLLEHPTRDQILATAFNRLHRQTNEGGSIEEEFRVEYVSDRVHTMGTAFLGLTLECARCHDHKFDPISQRDYYSLTAFFNSIDESGLYSHFTHATPTPGLLLWDKDTEKRHDAAVDSIADAEHHFVRARADAADRFGTWLESGAAASILPPRPVAYLRFEQVDKQHTPDSVSTNLALVFDNPELVPGHAGRAMKFSGDNSLVVPYAAHFGRTDPFSFSLWLKPAEKQDRALILHCSRAWTDSGSRGYELRLDDGRPFFALIHFWPGNAIGIRARDALPIDTWTHLAVTYDGSSRAEGIRLYADGRPLEVELVRDHLYKDIQHRAEWGDAEVGQVHLTLAGRFRDSGFRNGAIDELQVFDTELTPLEVDALAGNPSGHPPSPADLKEHYLARVDPACAEARETLHHARVVENDLITPVKEIMVMQEMTEQRPTFVLRRGAYDARGDRVEPDVPERIMTLSPDLPRNRLGLARWITDRRNPLTARVAVNRIWKLHFGRGLVATTWDFGAQGELPTHPQLLDWLACRYMDSGWDRKAMHRLIALSATYRQSSSAPTDLVARDPDNRLLARGPRHRLDAEEIRDSALAVSGLLVPVIGGPSVKPYQPAGIWEDSGTGKTYKQDTGAGLYRRSLYTFWRRTAPPPSMLTFDATSREVCTAKREITTTPLQALVLLNDTQFLEAARVLAEHLIVSHPDDRAARAREAFRRLTGRHPDATELGILTRLDAEQEEYFESHPGTAAQYLGVGERSVDTSLPAPELAATTVLASTLMNHEAFVMNR